MQGEIYTDGAFGLQGNPEFSVKKLLAEQPEYFVFNGAVGAIIEVLHPLRSKVGDTVRIYFGVGGPNFTSSFHVIGEIFDRVYALGGVLSSADSKAFRPSASPLVAGDRRIQDQGAWKLYLGRPALARAERGLLGVFERRRAAKRDIYNGQVMSGIGH